LAIGGMAPDREAPVYAISVAAELAGVHPQTLRTYEREGLVTPKRSGGNVRRYSVNDLERLAEIQRLTQEEGLNLAGVRMVLGLRDALRDARRRAERLEAELERMAARLREEVAAAHASHRYELVPLPRAALERYWRGAGRRNVRRTDRS
jgi:MerR family transcriptional regulator, heat shock protein HspR